MLADTQRIHRARPVYPTPVRKFLQGMGHHARHRNWRDLMTGPGPMCTERDLTRLCDNIAQATHTVEIFSATVDGILTRQILDILTALSESVKIGFWFGPAGIDSPVEQALRDHHATLHPLQRCRESFVVTDSVLWSAQTSILGREPGMLLRTDHSMLAHAVRRQSLRRKRPRCARNWAACRTLRLRAVTDARGDQRADRMPASAASAYIAETEAVALLL